MSIGSRERFAAQNPRMMADLTRSLLALVNPSSEE
jgi:hypothetical protein